MDSILKKFKDNLYTTISNYCIKLSNKTFENGFNHLELFQHNVVIYFRTATENFDDINLHNKKIIVKEVLKDVEKNIKSISPNLTYNLVFHTEVEEDKLNLSIIPF